MTAGATTEQFDVVVVGARCAGAALAKRLSSAGLSVVLLDAARLPSDQPNSTHLIQPPGMDELDALGLGDPVRDVTPALYALRLAYDAAEVRLPYGGGRAAHCLRRASLDSLLQTAAAEAAVDIRPEHRVDAVLRSPDGRVRGVEVRRRAGGAAKRFYADLVVGADGRHSTIAGLVNASEYLAYDGPRATYWAYWPRPSGWDPHEACNFFTGDDARVVFPADGDLLLIATVPSLRRARGWRSDHAAAYLRDVRSDARIGPRLEGAEPVGRVRGVLKCRYFFRVSAGRGWALIGDAGHHKEFVVGLGISDALRDARTLAAAILEHEPRALERWWRRRDVERIEMFNWSRDLGRDRTVDALQRLTATRLATSRTLASRFGEVIDGRRSPHELVPAGHAARWVAGALLGGDTAVLPPLVDAAERRARAWRELRRRKRLLQAGPSSPGPVDHVSGRSRRGSLFSSRRPAQRESLTSP
jgi:flavin-dependent dehydrogenase